MAMKQRAPYLIGILIGLAIFLLARGGFMTLLAQLGYVDGQPGSFLVSTLFLTCMFVMCAGYGVGLAVWINRRFRRN